LRRERSQARPPDQPGAAARCALLSPWGQGIMLPDVFAREEAARPMSRGISARALVFYRERGNSARRRIGRATLNAHRRKSFWRALAKNVAGG